MEFKEIQNEPYALRVLNLDCWSFEMLLVVCLGHNCIQSRLISRLYLVIPDGVRTTYPSGVLLTTR